MKISLVFLMIIVGLHACVPAEEIIITDINTSIKNEKFQQVYQYQDKQQLDSILAFTSDIDPTYRLQTANALASIENVNGIDSLIKLLSDINPTVQTAAAYAIGQQGDAKGESSLLSALVMVDTMSNNTDLNQTIIEAIGKCGKASLLDALASTKSYKLNDDKLLLGQALGVYRFLQRGITSQVGTDRMIQMVIDRSYPNEARVIASNYIYRAKDLDIEDNKFQITTILQNDPDYRIRMAIAYALRHTKDEDIVEILLSQLDTENDYRVKVNIIRALKSYPYINIIEKVLAILGDENLHVAQAAADYLYTNGQPADASLYRNYIKEEMHWSVKAKVLGSVLKHLPRNYANTRFKLNNELKKSLVGTENIYEKIAYIDALASDVVNYKLIYELATAESSPVIKSSIFNGLQKILNDTGFTKAFRTNASQRRIKNGILEYIKQGVSSSESGVITSAASILSQKDLGFKDIVEDNSFLTTAINNLSLPKDTETKIVLESAVATLNGTEYKKKDPAYNHPIEWTSLQNISDSTRVRMRTSKGDIVIKLLPNETPGSVANFVQLAKANYYDDKVFHRVVPAFVIQGGCPIGDGSGSLDYTIRSEVPQNYYHKEGMVGMASAGLHTEGVQFFITHAPAPHLDGKYTIFGEVIRGMDVVNDIHVGDNITDILFESI